MTVHKLSAGEGYTYLTRQVASSDEVRPRGQSLADYYAARGNPPGVWLGAGAAQLGLAGSAVSEAQMRSLFGAGRHPDAEAMLADGADRSAVRLGTPFPNYADLPPYLDRVAAKEEEFIATYGRSPSEAERNAIAAKEARRGRRAVAGFDLVFTPVKSASVLWGLADRQVREQVEAAHHAAVSDTIAWVEEHAAFTRTGHGGVAQVDTTGLICAAFDHRESRSGDPDLHTHVAIANKVCGADGKWRALDARGLFALGVAASERYNTRFEDELVRRLGVRFTERPGGSPDKRPVREIVGIPAELVAHFSRRRAAIETRLAELRQTYRANHGREPDHATALRLAQQATLETREGKPAGRSLAEQAVELLGAQAVERAMDEAIGHRPMWAELDDAAVHRLASEVVGTVAEQRSTWTIWNIQAEAERSLRSLSFASPEAREAATSAVVTRASSPELSIRIGEPTLVAEPPALTRASDGQSVFLAHGSERFTCSEVLLAEDRLVAAGREHAGTGMDDVVVQAALAIHESRSGVCLDPGQRRLVERFAAAPQRLAVGIGPAGAGKTTAMQAFTHAWHAGGGRVVPLATSAKAAQVLGSQLGARAENVHKFLFEHDRGTGPEEDWYRLRPGDVLLVDEAGMAGTLQLARLLQLAEQSGAALRLLGDPAQLAAVDAGGALNLLEREVGATHLTELHRFTDPHEGRATLMLRDGNPDALAFYTHRDRIRSGAADAMLEAAYTAWAADVAAGKTSVLIAASTAEVTALNTRARHDRVAFGQVATDGVLLRDANFAGVGDWVVTRENARALRYRRAGWVHNGDVWRVVRRHRDGSLTVRHLENNGKVRLPADYVAEAVELAYASTAHRVQGATTDTAHTLVIPEMTREALYVAATRGRAGSRWYVTTETNADLDCEHEPNAPCTADEVLAAVLRRSGAEKSATATLRDVQDEATNLGTLIKRYEHARSVAAGDVLGAAVDTLPDGQSARVMSDSGATHLAGILAAAAGRGADPARVLRAAWDLDDLGEVHSVAVVLAARIEDHPQTLGIPDTKPAGPLPWLPAPDVGHPGWLPYLRERAALIESRAADLGTLSAAYREQYEVADPTGLGDAPEPGTRRATAFRAAVAEQQAAAPDRHPSSPSDVRPTAPSQSGTATTQHRASGLSR